MKPQEQEIKELYYTWRNAVIGHDIRFLAQLFSDDFTSHRNVGKPKSKTEELLWLAVRNVQYLYWEDKNILIDAAGEIAVVTCDQKIDALVYELPAKINREILLTFIKQDKQWQLQQFKEFPARFTPTN